MHKLEEEYWEAKSKWEKHLAENIPDPPWLWVMERAIESSIEYFNSVDKDADWSEEVHQLALAFSPACHQWLSKYGVEFKNAKIAFVWEFSPWREHADRLMVWFKS